MNAGCGIGIEVLGTQDTAFVVESGRYCAIGPRHGADLLLRYKHLVKAGHKGERDTNDAIAFQV